MNSNNRKLCSQVNKIDRKLDRQIKSVQTPEKDLCTQIDRQIDRQIDKQIERNKIDKQLSVQYPEKDLYTQIDR